MSSDVFVVDVLIYEISELSLLFSAVEFSSEQAHDFWEHDDYLSPFLCFEQQPDLWLWVVFYTWLEEVITGSPPEQGSNYGMIIGWSSLVSSRSNYSLNKSSMSMMIIRVYIYVYVL